MWLHFCQPLSVSFVVTFSWRNNLHSSCGEVFLEVEWRCFGIGVDPFAETTVRQISLYSLLLKMSEWVIVHEKLSLWS